MLQVNDIRLLMLSCDECNYQFRYEIPIICPQCKANTSTPLLNPYQKETLFALVHSNPYRNHNYDNWDYNAYLEKMEFRDRFKFLLEGYGWYDHSRISMQACWIALLVLPERNDQIIFALSFFEDAFANALPTDEAEIEDEISIDI